MNILEDKAITEQQNMPQRSSNELAQDRTEMADSRTNLALERSIMAADRTLMAVMRTSVSLIGFGFTLYKFFEYMRKQSGFESLPSFGPRNLGLAMIFLGAVMLFISTWQHIVYSRKLSAVSGHRFPISASMIGSIVMFVIGFLTILSILFRIGPF
ncbi:MAG: DUF202 domain-containing protein [Hyphomicrobiales bacterium]|nr:DUF202 domain-containing protein [Hyphomicrobiales bacterium]